MKLWLRRNENLVVSGLVFLTILIIAIQAFLLGDKYYGNVGPYTHYNNYIIFKESFVHLVNGENLYATYPSQHWDIFKYTPTLALFFGIFKIFPDVIGLALWNSINAGILLWSLIRLKQHLKFSLWLPIIFVIPDLITSIQNFQSNALIAALIIHAWIFLERKNVGPAVFCIAAAMFIKPFAIVAFAMFLLYPYKLKSAVWTVVATLMLFVLPIPITGFSALIAHYSDWMTMLQNDHDIAVGISVTGILQSITGAAISKTFVLFVGAAIFMLPFIWFRNFVDVHFRAMILASVLIWIVIFNHKAESPTFIIAVSGVAIWFLTSDKRIYEKILLILCFILTCLSASDIFPTSIREEIVKPYNLKALPCIVIWLVIIVKLIKHKATNATSQTSDSGQTIEFRVH